VRFYISLNLQKITSNAKKYLNFKLIFIWRAKMKKILSIVIMLGVVSMVAYAEVQKSEFNLEEKESIEKFLNRHSGIITELEAKKLVNGYTWLKVTNIKVTTEENSHEMGIDCSYSATLSVRYPYRYREIGYSSFTKTWSYELQGEFCPKKRNF